MTKNEFKLRALLAMCSNPEYVDGMDLQVESMIDNANILANKAKEIVYFEDPTETIDRTLQDISSAIEEISMPDGKLDFMNDTLKGIEKSLDYMNNQISKIIVEDEEEAAEDCDS